MDSLFPILAAVLQAGSFTLDKVILSIKRVSYKTYVGVSFPLGFFIALVIFFIFRPPLSLALLSGNLWWMLLLAITLAIIGNLVFYRALDDDTLGEMQTLGLLGNVPIILFASIFFVDERKLMVVLLSLVASFVVAWAHIEKHHFKIAKHTLPFLLWGLVTAPVGAALSKALLVSWNPISLELVRGGVMALVLGPLFFKDAVRVSSKTFWLLFLTNVLTTIAWILFYFSYQRSGIVYTVLIFSLQPLLVYLASVFLLKERLQWKKAVAFVVVLISIGAAQVLG